MATSSDGSGGEAKARRAHDGASRGRIAGRRRGAISGAALCLCTVAAWLLCGSTPALALSQRGHVFSFSFGAAGQGPGQFKAPSAIALNQSNGDLYVADRANNVVERFQPVIENGRLKEEKFVGQFTVVNPESIAVDSSTSSNDPSAGDVYVAGSTKHLVKEEEPEDKIVYKFKPTGIAITKLRRYKEEQGEEGEEFEPIEGLAVDPGGRLLVYDEEDVVAYFDNAVKNKALFSVETEFGTGTHGLALDTAGDLYVGHVSENPGAAGPEGEPPVVGKCEVEAVGRECESLVEELDQQATTAVAVNTADVPGNLVSELGDSYIDNVARIGGQSVTTVAAFSPSGSPIQRFGAPGLKEGSGIAVDSSSGTVFVTDAASAAVYVFELEAAGAPRVDSVSSCGTSCGMQGGSIRLQAEVDPSGADTHAHFEYGLASCASSQCAATPDVDLEGGFGAKPISEELKDLQPGTYHYRVVAGNSVGTVRSVERSFTIVASVSALPDGRAWEMVSPPCKGGYEPEAIAAQGGTIQAAVNGAAITFVTDGPMPCDGALEGNRLPEENQIISLRGSSSWISQDIVTANTSGGGAREGTTQEYQAFSPNLALGLLEPFIGSQGTSPLAEPPLSPPQSEHERTLEHEEKPYQEKSIYLRANAPLAPEQGEGTSEREQQHNYDQAAKNGKIMGNAGFVALVTEANALGTLGGAEPGDASFAGGFHEGLELLTATPDLGHVLFKSWKAAPGLYEWGPDPQLQLVSVLPKNEQGQELPAPGGPSLVLGDYPNVRHTISNDGSRVFWTTTGEGTRLYVRDTQAHETLQLDAGAAGANGNPSAHFQTASADGSKVFFTDSQRLTADSRASEGKPDLYVFELKRGTPLSGTLTDLTPNGVHGEGAAVQGIGGAGGVLGASEDGSYIYFVANGALAEGDTPGNCAFSEVPQPGRSCNLYVTHFNGTGWDAPKFIARLSNEDAPDWGATGEPGRLIAVTSRVSPNGEYVSFMSNRSLTGYDNEDRTSKAPGERLDEEVFLYRASTETLVCASCNPTGARPVGVFDPGALQVPGAEPEGVGLLVDRPQVWGALIGGVDHWLAGSVPGWTPISIELATYQSRYLSDEGRLFFNSPDLLVPAVAEPFEKALEEGKQPTSKEKVYQYEPNGLGDCASAGGCIGLLSAPSGAGERESAFLDASENGDDVFFLTAARLPAVNGVSQDVDSNFDVYDARICHQAASSSCLPAPALGQAPCNDVATCKTAAGAPPSFIAPASMSVSVSASGNVLPSRATEPPAPKSKPKPKHATRAQKLSNALKACRRLKKKSKRLACEKQARKTYGPLKSKAKKHTHKGKRK